MDEPVGKAAQYTERDDGEEQDYANAHSVCE
jgi:hypothetical protein